MTDIDFDQIIKLGQEQRDIEYKTAGYCDDLRLKLVKASLAMANKRNGGFIVIGVKQEGGRHVPEGLSEDQLDSFDEEAVQSLVDKYADPYIRLSVHKPKLDGMDFVVLRVREFAELPVLCKRDWQTDEGKLTQGAFYVRPLGGCPRSEVVRDVNDLREALDLAIDKQVRKALARCLSASEAEAGQSESQAFDAELGGM